MNRPAPPPPIPAALLERELRDLRERQQRLFADLAAGQQRFRRLARSVLAVQEHERRRFARELHDGLGQNLTVLQHELEALGTLLEPGSVAQGRATRALDLCRGVLHDTRQLSRLLRPQVLDDLGLGAALHWLMRSLSEPGGFEPELYIDPTLPGLGEEIDTMLFRIAQEALNNVVRHARASHVAMRLQARAHEVQLWVMDDGVGCDPAEAFARSSRGEATGLAAMQERVQLLGGDLRLVSNPGEGTQVRVRLPLDAAEVET